MEIEIKGAKMEIEKNMKKETAWRIKLDKNVMLTLNAIEDSSFPESNVSVVLSEGDRKVSFTMTKDKFLNLTGVLDSFSQVCLGVEPVLPQEDYAIHEPKVSEKKAEKAESAPATRPKQEAMEAPVKKLDEPRPAPPAPIAPAKQPEPAKATSAESRMLAKLEGKTPPKIAFPPRFPSASSVKDEEPEEVEEAKATELEEDLAQLDFDIPEAEPIPAPARVAPSPPAKPSPPPTSVPKITLKPAKAAQTEEEKESAPEWDPW